MPAKLKAQVSSEQVADSSHQLNCDATLVSAIPNFEAETFEELRIIVTNQRQFSSV